MSGRGEFNSSVPTHSAIFRSWKSMKTWVMIWLWSLNAIYWPAFFWLDRVEARFALLAYFSILPFAAAIAVPQRGLTRLSGVMHLPFLVLVLWLSTRIFSNTYESLYGVWLQTLFWATTICVAFDIIDVIRWFRGERYRLGTPDAVEMHASKAANWTDP